MRKLSFQEEAEQHIDNLPRLRSQADCALVDSYEIDCKGSDTFVIIPCHIKEKELYESLLAYKDAGINKDLRVIVYLNAGSAMTPEQFASLLTARSAEIEAAQKALPSLQIQVIAQHFEDNAIISRIRGIITDALIKCCLKQGLSDPILVSNDADALHYSRDYVPKIQNAFRSTRIDFLSGAIYWTGSDSDGYIRYKPAVGLPEIYLNDLLGQSGDEVYREFGSVYTTGCNSAFRLASVAAIGGYDYEFAPFFDVEIGTQLKNFRYAESKEAVEESYTFLSDCVLSTNPRRAFLAFFNKIPYGHQFDTVGKILGADLSINEFIDEYLRSAELIQADDLLAYSTSLSAQEKVHSRIRANYLHFLEGEPAHNKAAFTQLLCERAGLSIRNMEVIDPTGNNALQVSNIDFDWSDCTLPRRLADWIRLNTSSR